MNAFVDPSSKFVSLMNDMQVGMSTDERFRYERVWNAALESQATLDTKPHPLHHVGVAVVLYDENEVLFQRRRKDFGHGNYVLPGGTMDEADPKAAIEREIKEELGVEVVSGLDFLMPLYFANDQKSDGSPYLMLYFAMKAHFRGQEQNLEPDKCYSLHWCSLDKLPVNMWKNDRTAVELFRRRRDLCQR